MGARVYKHGAIIYDSIPVFSHTVFWRDIVIRNAGIRELSAHPHVTSIAIGRTVLLHDIMTKTRALIGT
jgi:hypothetical protein